MKTAPARKKPRYALSFASCKRAKMVYRVARKVTTVVSINTDELVAVTAEGRLVHKTITPISANTNDTKAPSTMFFFS